MEYGSHGAARWRPPPQRRASRWRAPAIRGQTRSNGSTGIKERWRASRAWPALRIHRFESGVGLSLEVRFGGALKKCLSCLAPRPGCAALTRDGIYHPCFFFESPVHPRGPYEMGPNPSSEVRNAKLAQQPGSCADLVDAFGRVHMRASEDLPGYGDRGTPNVLTKLKKWAGTLRA